MVRGLLTGLLTEAHWKVLQVEGDEKAVGTEMQRTQADIGLVPTAGDKLDVIAQDGSKLSYDTLQSLLAFLVLQRGAQRLVLPMRASEELVSLARRFGANTVRVSEKTLFQTMMEQDIEAAAIHMDACAAAMHICQILSETGEPLEKLLLELPQSCRSETSVNCSWRDIGKIFRTLVETQPRENLDLLEGVRVRHEKGWALVMPDVEAARCRILCESASEEYAESLMDMYAKKIQEIVQEKANESS